MRIILPALGWQGPLYRHLLTRWISPLADPYIALLAWAIAFVALRWLMVFVMDKWRTCLKR